MMVYSGFVDLASCIHSFQDLSLSFSLVPPATFSPRSFSSPGNVLPLPLSDGPILASLHSSVLFISGLMNGMSRFPIFLRLFSQGADPGMPETSLMAFPGKRFDLMP